MNFSKYLFVLHSKDISRIYAFFSTASIHYQFIIRLNFIPFHLQYINFQHSNLQYHDLSPEIVLVSKASANKFRYIHSISTIWCAIFIFTWTIEMSVSQFCVYLNNKNYVIKHWSWFLFSSFHMFGISSRAIVEC